MLSPNRFRAGETMTWDYSHRDYGPDEYALFVNFGSAAGAFQAAGAGDGAGGWTIDLAASATSGKTPGSYRYQVVVETGEGDALERHVLEEGTVELLARLDGTSSTDARSEDEKTLDAIRAAIRGTATDNQLSVAIADTQVSRMSLDELMRAEAEYLRRVARARRRSRRTQVRLGR